MELSSTSLPGVSFSISRTSILISPSPPTFLVPTKVSCIPERFSETPNRYCGHNNKKIILHQSKNRFPGINRKISSYGRITIPLIKVVKATGKKNGAHKFDSSLAEVTEFSDVLRFMKPHPQLGTIVAFISIMTRSLLKNPHLVMMPKWMLLAKTMVALFALSCSTGFVSGINQIYDVEIDKINKPHYPIASGKLSLGSAWIIVISFIAIGVPISSVLKSGWLLVFVLRSVVLGSIYSVPPFSIKRSTIGAVLTCAALGFTAPLIMSGVAREILGLPFQLSIPMVFMTINSTLVFLVFGAIKDIEDLEGDKMHNVPTLASIYGSKKITLFSFGSMLLNYSGAITTTILLPQIFKRSVMIPSYIILSSCLIFQTWKLNKANYAKEAGQAFHQSLYKLLTAQYLIFPFI